MFFPVWIWLGLAWFASLNSIIINNNIIIYMTIRFLFLIRISFLFLFIFRKKKIILEFQIAGTSTDFVNKVLEKVKSGIPNGGLYEI